MGNCDSIARFYPNENGQTGCVSGSELSDSSFSLSLLFPSNTNEILNPEFTISLQPITDNITITDSTPFVTIDIYTMTGAQIKSYTNLRKQTETNLDLSELDEGIYILTTRYASGKSYSQKLIKM